MKTYKPHPAAKLFPMMSDAELKDLAADIQTNGQHDPIIITSEDLVLDGRNRLAACELAGVEPEVELWDREDDGISPTAWVISKNLHRRHLSDGQRVLVAIEVLPMFEKEARARQKAAGGNRKALSDTVALSGRGGKATEQAAKALNVGTRTVERAKATIAAASPDDLEQIRAGKKTLNQVSRQIGIRRAVSQAKTYEVPAGEYPVIVADPPWQYDDALNGSMNRGLEYPTMELAEICALQLPAAKDCILWLWTTKSHLLDGSAAAVMKAWGFAPRSMLTWVKSNMGLGRWLRNRCEFAILAIRGNPAVDLHSQEDVLLQTGPRLRHSEKPPEFFALVESLCPAGPKLEMFARAPRAGWVTTGSGLPKTGPKELGIPPSGLVTGSRASRARAVGGQMSDFATSANWNGDGRQRRCCAATVSPAPTATPSASPPATSATSTGTETTAEPDDSLSRASSPASR